MIGYKMARRRGRNAWGWAFLGLLPYFNFIFLLYLASQPEQWMVDRLESLENRLDAAADGPRIRPSPAAADRPAIL